MNEGDDLCVWILFQCIFYFLWVYRLSPFVFNHHRSTAASLYILDHASAEYPITAYDHLITGIDHIDEAHLHPYRARARDWEGQ